MDQLSQANHIAPDASSLSRSLRQPTRTRDIDLTNLRHQISWSRAESQNPHLCRKERGKDGAADSLLLMQMLGLPGQKDEASVPT